MTPRALRHNLTRPVAQHSTKGAGLNIDTSNAVTHPDAVSRTVRELLDRAKADEFDDVAAAHSHATKARSLARSFDDGAGEAEASYRLASLAHYAGHGSEAFALAVAARDLASKSGAPVVEAWALNLMGIVHLRAGNHSGALACCLRGLELYRATDHRIDEGNLLNTIATIHHSLGDTDRALTTYSTALAVNRELARPDFDAITLANMAQLRAERGEFELAVSLGESALDLAREHAAGFVPEVLATLGEAYSRIGDLERAAIAFDQGLHVLVTRAEQTGETNPSGVIAVRTARAKSSIGLGHLMRAEADLMIALDIAQRSTMRSSELAARELLADVYKRLGRFEEALAQQEVRFAIHRELFDQGADLRIKTLQIAHDTERARNEAEILRLRTTKLEALVQGRTHELEEYQLEAFQRLAVLAEFRDTDTGEHTVRVGNLAADVAIELGEDPAWCDQLRMAARLHDIGKVAMPDAILLKPGPLTFEEFAVMKTHTTIGAQILSGSTSPLIQLGAVIALNHHERWDGTGYPNGLSGTDIPRSGRIVTVADVYDALTTERIYKHAWTHADAVDYIVAGRGAQFEPEIVDAFLQVMSRREVALSAPLH